MLLRRMVGLDPSEILPRISQGDPFGIQTVVMRCLREEALVIDPDRALERALLEVAHELSLAANAEDLAGEWLQRSVDRALARTVRDDQEAERENVPINDVSPYAYVHDAYATPIHQARLSTVRFNALPHRARLAFFLLLVDGRSVDECLEIGMWEPEELRMDVWEALCALGHLSEEEVETFRGRKEGQAER